MKPNAASTRPRLQRSRKRDRAPTEAPQQSEGNSPEDKIPIALAHPRRSRKADRPPAAGAAPLRV